MNRTLGGNRGNRGSGGDRAAPCWGVASVTGLAEEVGMTRVAVGSRRLALYAAVQMCSKLMGKGFGDANKPAVLHFA